MKTSKKLAQRAWGFRNRPLSILSPMPEILPSFTRIFFCGFEELSYWSGMVDTVSYRIFGINSCHTTMYDKWIWDSCPSRISPYGGLPDGMIMCVSLELLCNRTKTPLRFSIITKCMGFYYRQSILTVGGRDYIFGKLKLLSIFTFFRTSVRDTVPV